MTPQHYAQAWYLALKDAKQKDWETISQYLLRRLQREGRLSSLPQIVNQIKELEAKDSGRIAVDVTTATDYDEKELIQLVSELTGEKDVEMTLHTDADLIGGVLVRTKDEQWDVSVKNHLEQLKEQLRS